MAESPARGELAERTARAAVTHGGAEETACWHQAHYPALANADPVRNDKEEIHLGLHDNDLTMVVPPSPPGSPSPATLHCGSYYFLPSAGGPRQVIAPLLSSWILRHAFSMLARYSPQSWARMLDFGQSGVAAQVEYLQEQSLIMVPQLIAESLKSLG